MTTGKLVVVLGMHRSGTSAITNGLSLLGVSLGDDLHPAGFDNPKGFWEDVDFLEINEKLLEHLGSSYDAVGMAWQNLAHDPELHDLRMHAKLILEKKLAESDGCWAFKDPRTCRLLAFWQSVFAAMDVEVSYVVVLRNPLSIADSLATRNAIPTEKSCLLWLHHQLPAILQTAGAPRVVVNYDDFMDEPYAQLSRIASAFELPIPSRTSRQFVDFENEFLKKDLRHTQYNSSSLFSNAHVPVAVAELFALLADVAADLVSLDNELLQKQILIIQAVVAGFAPVYSYINELEKDRSLNWKTISDITVQRERVSADFNSLNLKYEDLNQAYQNALQAADHLESEKVRLLKQIAAQRQELESTSQQFDQARQQLDQSRHEVHALLTSTSWKVTSPLRAIMRSLNKLRLLRIRPTAARVAQLVWRSAPFDASMKARIKEFLFVNFSIAFRHTAKYQIWLTANKNAHIRMLDVAGLDVESQCECYVPLLRGPVPTNVPVRLIAFYLPQFHAIKENDEWWGEGFTEWTNVRPALPQFQGHYQPHVPGELGYYNLLDKEVQRRQIELAKLYGVGGFCFYYYWFGGKRLIEKPLDAYLSDPSLDFPFCICWANENWSRRWDGMDSEILIAQNHSPEDDLAFADDAARYLRDPRYIRIDGKPLLIVYRPSLLPNAVETVQRWRRHFREIGLGEVYLAYTQSFEAEDPRIYSFDAAIEFPPNNTSPANVTGSVAATSDFSGTVYDLSTVAVRSESYQQVPYKLFRSVCPSWDNTARRKNRGTIFLNSTPQTYQKWLTNAVQDTCERFVATDERLVFVNAWNEWAEGAHLEPDQKYGYAWLDATRKALTGEKKGPHREQILVVSHDAHPHGAQFLALGIVRSLSQDLKLQVTTLLLGDGRLRDDFAKFSEVFELYPGEDFEFRSQNVAVQLAKSGITRAIVNTTVSGLLIKTLADHGIDCVSLVHEMPDVINSRELAGHAQSIALYAKQVVFPADTVKDGFALFARVPEEKSVVRPQGVWRRNMLRFSRDQVRLQVRQQLGVAPDTPLVLSVGYADHRKGIDLFVAAGLSLLAMRPDAVMIWIGHWDPEIRPTIEKLIGDKQSSFHFLGYEPKTAAYHVAADVYALCSREDPFPNVVIESFDAGVPVVAFEGTGGGADLVSRIGGKVVPKEDTAAFALALSTLIADEDARRAIAIQVSELVDSNYSFRHYLYDIVGRLHVNLPKISVVVPNFNYANFIKNRLSSIVGQTVPIYELIILDDASTDGSVAVIADWCIENNIECRIVVNEENSGSVFSQWAKGISLATGDYLWIAEADDLSTPDFLASVLPAMERNGNVVLSFCESQQIDQNGARISMDYKAYRSVVDDHQWDTPYIADGYLEIQQHMAVANTIPNVSSVLFRLKPLSKVFEQHLTQIQSLPRAGDWLAYVRLLQMGSIAFNPRAANLHRRHGTSVVASAKNHSLLKEIKLVQKIIADEFNVPELTIENARRYIQLLSEQLV